MQARHVDDALTERAHQALWRAVHAGALTHVMGLRSRIVPSMVDVDERTWAAMRLLIGVELLEPLVVTGCSRPDAAAARMRAAQASMLAQQDRERVGAALKSARVPHAFLKGLVADALWWAGSGLRASTDVDVLVSSVDERAAFEAVQSLGYREFIGSAPPQHGPRSERMLIPVDPRSLPVDLHLRLFKSPPYVELGEEMLARAVARRTSLGDIVMLTPEDMLLHAAGNLARTQFAFGRVKLALDAWCLTALEQLDVTALVERAHRAQLGWAVYALLWLVKDKLGGYVDEELMRCLEPHLHRRALARAVASDEGLPRWRRSRVGRVLVEAALLDEPARAFLGPARKILWKLRDHAGI